MAKQALLLWRELEADTGAVMLTTTGQLTFGPGLDELRAGLAAAGADFDVWSSTESARRFPDIAPPGPALFEPESGVIHADRCLKMLRFAVDASLHEGVAVNGLVDHGSGVYVETTSGTITASVAVCCAGPWTASVLATAGIDLALSASLEQVAYFASRHSGVGQLPVIIERADPLVYGLPTPDGGLFKVGRHQSYAPVALAGADLSPDPDDDRPLVAAVARLLPRFGSRPVNSERCFYDNSPDEDFVVDRVGRIVIGAGTSGHGFKFGPLLGEVLADLAQGLNPRVSIGWLAASRAALATR
jgi:sarcosine oxidase